MNTSVISDYLLPGYKKLTDVVEGEKFKSDSCFCKKIPSLFGIEVPCGLYDQVTNGEGDEKEKINTIYSSSLQSLLIFSQVSDKHPLSIYGNLYTEVYFEYKNAVITKPSSIDVVLSNKKGQFLFIESKLTEILASNDKGCPEVGPGYLSKHVNGYSKLGLNLSDLKTIGIDVPDGIAQNELYFYSSSDLKKRLEEALGEKFSGKLIIKPIGENTYVYSYGIKQFLAHIIGIMNVNDPDSKSDDYLIKDRKLEIEKVAFLSIYNDFPEINQKYSKEIRTKLANFKNHEIEVTKVLKNRRMVPFTIYEPLSYQEIYNENITYFDNMPKVRDFYHLGKGETR